MKKSLSNASAFGPILAAALVLTLGAAVCAQAADQPAPAAAPSTPAANRALAYYHAALAGMYEDNAISEGRPDEVTRAIEEYKLALNADPDSPSLNDELADLYFRTGRVHDAEMTAKNLLKSSPDDVDAHKLLGRIYLRQLGEGQNGGSSAASSAVLDEAIAEFEKIIQIQPQNIENRMVLGQLYTVKHQPQKAEEEFRAAQAIEPDSEDVVLNLVRLYATSGDLPHAIKTIEMVPEDQRSPKMEFTLGSLYDQVKQPQNAVAAYKRAAEMQPDDLQTMDALAQALLNDDQLEEALKQYQTLASADPENSEALIHIAEIQRRLGKYDDALATVRKARKLDPSSLEAGYNEGMLLDVLGHLNQAAQTYQEMVDLTSHANGAYTSAEKNNRSIFLSRLGSVYLEQNKIDQAVAAYQKMIDLGGDSAVRGYQGQVDAYRSAHEFDKAIDVARKAVDADPTNRDLKLMLAGELADHGQVDEGLNMAKSLLKGNNDDRIVYQALAQMDIRLRRWKDAEDAISKAEPLSTKKADKTYLLFLRGELAEQQKHMEPAEQYFKQALDLDPQNAMTMNYLGYMWADRGEKLPEALKLIRKAVELEPWNGAYLDSLGWVYFKLGDYELAEDNLRQAVQRDQTDPTVHMHLGDLYEKTGRIRLAAAQWELSLAEFAKSPPADIEPGDVSKVQKKLESARVKLAKQEDSLGQVKPQ
ncbi:MAG: tetratricopeptide repeat protein [Acidobacteriota bacterium]